MTSINNPLLTEIQIKFLQSLGDLLEEMNLTKKNTDEVKDPTPKVPDKKEIIQSKIDEFDEELKHQSSNPTSVDNENTINDTSYESDEIDFEVTKDILIIGKNGKSYIYDEDKIYKLLKNGWSQAKIANTIGVAQPSFNKYVKSNPKYSDVIITRNRGKQSDDCTTSNESEDPL